MSEITGRNLIDAGYRRWEDPLDKTPFYQKRYKIDGSTAFFMEIYEYDFSQFANYSGPPIRFSVQNQIELEDGNTVNLEWSLPVGWTIESAESAMLAYWTALKGKYYE